MEGMEAAARPAGGSLQEPQIGSRTASSMQVTSAVERSDPEPQPENGHLPRPWPCPREDGTPSPKATQPPGAPGIQLQGPSVLESKVRALKERMTAGRQGAGPSLTSHQRLALKKPKCRRVKVGGSKPPSEGPSPPEAVVVHHTQKPNDRRLDRSVTEEEPARNGDPGPPRLPAPGLECWNRRSPWPPEAVQTQPEHDRALPAGPSSLQEGPVHRVTPSRPGGSRPCNKTTHVLTLRKGRSHPQQDGLGTRGDPDSLSPTSEENFVPRPALLGELWRTRDLGALGTGGSTLSLSDRVERNRLLLQEMLSVGGQGPSKVGVPGWTSCWDRAVPERLAGDVDWDSGISLQDSDQSRPFGPKPQPVLSPRHEEAKHLLQRARMKARTRPVRASHDIVPTLALCSRDGRKSPALDPRMTIACRDNLQNGNTSDSSSGESSSGQWPKRGTSPSHVRFEDESARDAESRYLERLQQRQRQVLSLADQGPLRSKPDLADYIQGGCRRRDAGAGALHPLLGGLQPGGLSAPPPARGSERRCRACGHCIAPDPRGLREREPACGREGASAQPLPSQGLSVPLRLLSAAEPRLHTEWIRETHIGEQALPEEADSALDSTDTSDSCRTDSEEAGTSQPSKTRLRASRPRGGHRWLHKAEMEPPRSPQASHDLPGLELLEVSDEVTEDAGQTTAGALLPREDALSKPPVQDLKRAFPGSPWQSGPGLENHWAHPGDFRTAYTIASPMKLGSSGPGRQGPVIESQESLGTDCPQQSRAEPSAHHQARQPTASLCPDGWVPTPPSSKKTTSPVSHRKAALAGLRRLGNQREPMDSPLPASRSAVPRTCELTSTQPPPHSPHSRHPLRALSTNNCNSSMPQGLQEPWEGAILMGETGARSQDPTAPLEDRRDAVGTISSVGITFSPASEEPKSSQEAEGGLQRTEPSSVGHVSSRALSGVNAGPSPPSTTSDKNKKSSGGIASALGLKKFFSTLSQGTRPRMGKSRSYSVEQLQPPAPGPASHTGTPKVKRAPSLQSLHLVSPSRQHRKATSFQNLHSLLSGKVDRSTLYLVGEPGDHSAADRLGKAPARRALSVEDVSAPGPARAVGRLVEVFPDGTSQLQLQRPPEGTFGFNVASGNGRRDSGFYVQEMADESTAKLYSGLLGVGDEILEVNGAKVAGLGLAHVRELLAHAENLSIRVLRQRPVPR